MVLMAYQRKMGERPLREPVMVVSRAPIYSTERAMRSTFFFLAMAMPQGMGEPMNLCPEMEMLSAPAAKSKGGALSMKGSVMPARAASQWM